MKKILFILPFLFFACNTVKKQRQELIKQHDWPEYKVSIIRNAQIDIGFTYEQVKAALGKPVRVNRTTSKRYYQEQWVYQRVQGYNVVPWYVYFDETGKVTTIQR